MPIGALIEKKGCETRVIVIKGTWSARIAERIGQRPRVQTGDLIPIWCVDGPGDPKDLIVPAELRFHAGAWTEDMLRHWFSEENLSQAYGDPGVRRHLLRATGGAPVQLAAIQPILKEAVADNQESRIERIGRWAAGNPFRPAILGLNETAVEAIRFLDALGDDIRSRTDLDGVIEDTESVLAQLVVSGCMRLGPQGDMPRLTPLGRMLS